MGCGCKEKKTEPTYPEYVRRNEAACNGCDATPDECPLKAIWPVKPCICWRMIADGTKCPRGLFEGPEPTAKKKPTGR